METDFVFKMAEFVLEDEFTPLCRNLALMNGHTTVEADLCSGELGCEGCGLAELHKESFDEC